MLDPHLCRQRQKRLLKVMNDQRLDVAVLSLRHHVYWLTGHWPFWAHDAAAILTSDGRCTLISANAVASCPAADDVKSYEASWFSTHRQELPRALAEAVASLLPAGKTVGLDASSTASQLILVGDRTFVTIDEHLHQLRRRKEADELHLMRHAIGCTMAMYDRARQLIAPGILELDIFAELQNTAVRAAGEPLTPMHLGNDFACGVGGGPPRPYRAAKAGEIYILDLGPAYRGYFSDNCRAFAVDRNPTDAQMKAWRAITGVFPIIENLAKPGVRCRNLFEAGKQHLFEQYGTTLGHHLGHGVGLQPHEFPHINPKWDDVLEEGEIFTIEPGLYGPEINGGIRLENQYLVTADGVENLTPIPLEL
jgi:Xaa-Pro aminopeptidase